MGNDKKPVRARDFINRELWGMTLTLFSALGLFCLFSGNAVFYPVGGYIQGFLLGTLGFFSYPLFIFLLLTGIMLIVGKSVAKGKGRVTAITLALFVVFVFGLLHLAVNYPSGSYGEYISACYDAAKGGPSASTVGGALCALTIYPLNSLLSTVGLYILLIVLLVLCLAIVFRDVLFRKSAVNRPVKTDEASEPDDKKQDKQSDDRDRVRTVKEVHYVDSSSPRSAYTSADRSEKRLIFGDSTFEMKGEEPRGFDAKTDSPKTVATDGKTSGTKVYSEEYNRDFNEKLNYVKTPQKITPENLGKTVNTTMFINDKEETTRKREMPSIDESSPNEDIYIPKNYMDAVHDGGRSQRPSGAVYSRSVPDVPVDMSSDDASDDDVVPFDRTALRIDSDDVYDASDDFDEGLGGGNVSEVENHDGFDDYRDVSDGISSDSVDDVNDEYRTDVAEADEPDGPAMPRRTESIRPIGEDTRSPDFAERISAEEKASVAEPAAQREKEPEKKVNPFDEMPLNFKYNAPPLELLRDYNNDENYGEVEVFKREKATKILNTLNVLGGVKAECVNIVHGPTVTRFDLAIPDNISIKNVIKYTDDLKLRLETKSEIRFTTIPGTPYVGVEVPNDKQATVGLKTVIDSDAFKNTKKNSLVFAIGKNLIGNPVVADITKMPHLLIAGATGTGKSVGLNTLLVSLMYKYSPADLRFIIVDPKQVEFTIFSGIPHMMFDEIICDAPKAIAMLTWAVKEMEARYSKLREAMVRNIDEYNMQIDPRRERRMPRIVIIVDEFADLMSVDKKNIEDKIARIAQKARAAGMYLILATQRPSVNIMEGSIKTNFTSRMAFKMSNAVDSNTILNEVGAEKLLGRGDLLYKMSDMTNVERAQGAYIDTEEIKEIVKYLKDNNKCYFNEAALDAINAECAPQIESVGGKGGAMSGGSSKTVPVDHVAALYLAVQMGEISASSIQRRLHFGFPKAGSIIDWMKHEGYIVQGTSKQMKVVFTKEQYDEKYGEILSDDDFEDRYGLF